MSGFTTVVESGKAGSLVISEAGGTFKLVASMSPAIGGGSVEGAIKVVGSAEIDVGCKQLFDALCSAMCVKYSTMAPIIKGVQGAIDLLSASL